MMFSTDENIFRENFTKISHLKKMAHSAHYIQIYRSNTGNSTPPMIFPMEIYKRQMNAVPGSASIQPDTHQ